MNNKHIPSILQQFTTTPFTFKQSTQSEDQKKYSNFTEQKYIDGLAQLNAGFQLKSLKQIL